MTQLSFAIVLAAAILGGSLLLSRAHVSERYVAGSQPGYVWRLDRTTGALFYCGLAIPTNAQPTCNRFSIPD